MIIVLSIVAIIWVIASFYFIQKEQDVAKPIAYKIFITLTVLTTLGWTQQIFNPALSHFIGATEINSSFVVAVIAGAIIAAVITGPIAYIRYLVWKRKNDKWLEDYHKGKV